MTWTKLSDTYGDECADLSDAAFRLHTEALIWMMRRERGPDIDDRDIRRFSEAKVDPAPAINELLAAGFWTRIDWGYRLVMHAEHQPDPEVLAKRRQNDSERQRRKRRKAAGLPTEEEEVTA